MQTKIKVNGKLWIEIELDDYLAKTMTDMIDDAFSKVVKDKNRDKIAGFVIDPKALQ